MTICLTVKKANKCGAKKLCVSSGLYGHKEALALEAQMLINYLVDEIVMYDDKIEIFFHKPTRNSPDESRGCFVYKWRKENFDVEYGSCETGRTEDSEGTERHLETPISLTGKRVKKRRT